MEEHTSNFPPPRYIIKGYDPEFYGSVFIKDEDVVRPPNHRYTDKDTPSNWFKEKSTARCPTYGSCQICMMSGPVDECCVKCGENVRYLVPFYGSHTMDSIYLAELIGSGHVRARANRTQAWLTTPTMNTSSDNYIMAINRQAALTEEQKKDLRGRIYRELPN
jgi:hypothetical protein